MFKNVIVGVDGNEGGRDAIALASRLMQEDGRLTLAHVYPGEGHPWRGTSVMYDVLEEDEAHELLNKAGADAGLELEPSQLRWRGSPTPGRGLHELADEIGADLLVVGSSRRGLLGRVLVGDDTRDALDGAPCPIAVAPAGYSAHPSAIQTIGIGYDGSPESVNALTVARTLATEHGAKVSAMEVISWPAYLFRAPTPGDQTTVEDLVIDARDRVAALSGIEPHAAYGHPAEELALYSASLDLLVVGSRGYGPIRRMVHGSTSRELARTARSPLLVLPRAAIAPEATATSGDGSETVAAATQT